LCASFIKSDIHPKMYTATGKFHDSNQQIYYSNKNLEFQRKQDEINKQLANDYVKLHNEIIREQQMLEDKMDSHHVMQSKINQDLLKQISEHETVHAQLSNRLNEQQDTNEGLIEQIDKNKVELHSEMIREQQGLEDKVDSHHVMQSKINQDLLKQISEHETAHAQLLNQLNEQRDISEELIEQIDKNKVELHNEMIREQQGLEDKVEFHHVVQSKINQKLLKQISQHETVHVQLSDQLNEQRDISEGLIKQIDKNKVELQNEINEIICEQQILKDKVDSHHVMQSKINQDLLKQISQHETVHVQLSDQLNEQKNIGEELIEQIHKNETALIQLSKQLDAYCESIQEVKKQFDKYESMLSKQLVSNIK
jgi:hypothetical protein